METMSNHLDAEDAVHAAPVVLFDDVHMVFTSKLKKPIYALRGLTLRIEAGSVVGLLGPNGCGKTTAVSCLTGLLFPQQGNIRLWGKPVEKAVVHPRRNRIGVVLEDTRLPPFLTVKGALSSVCSLRNIPKKDMPRELERVIAITGVEPLLAHRINGLSKGQARRVGVASALISDPPLLIMDEPASGLDVAARIEFNDLIRNLRDGKRTILITSHLLSDVENTCTHIAIMQSGAIKVFDQTGQLIDNGDNDIDIYIHDKHTPALDQMGLPYTGCKYPRLVQLAADSVPACDILGMLSRHAVVPRRIEPKADLISYYIAITDNEA